MAIGSYAAGSVPPGAAPHRFVPLRPPIGILTLGRILESPGRTRLLVGGGRDRVGERVLRVRLLTYSDGEP